MAEEMEHKLAIEAGAIGSGSGGSARIRSASRKKPQASTSARSRPGSAISVASSASKGGAEEGGKESDSVVEAKEEVVSSVSQSKTPRTAAPKQRMMTLVGAHPAVEATRLWPQQLCAAAVPVHCSRAPCSTLN